MRGGIWVFLPDRYCKIADMEFSQFAEYLEKLEGTASRVEMTKILAEMFEKATAEDARLMAYMSQGKLGPAYNTPDFGLAEKQAVKAIAKGFEIEAEKVNEEFKKSGDLGKTAEKFKAQMTNDKKNSKLKIQNVYGRMYAIAEANGTGSQEEKIRLLAELLQELDGCSAKYAIKIVLGKLRTGFSSMTVLDALSWMITGDKSLRENIEQIYNVRADLGEVAKIVKSLRAGEFKSISVDPIFGTPVLTAQAEREKSPEAIWERMKEIGCVAEHKLDGLRIEAHVRSLSEQSKPKEVKLFSRGLEDVTAMYPDIVEGLKKQVKEDSILDGEMIAVGKDGKYLPFQETVQRKRKYDIEEMLKEVPLKYYTFDLISAGGKSQLQVPNKERREKLEKLVTPGETVRLMPRKEMRSPEEIDEFFKEALAEGTEGIVVKRLDSNYQSGSRNYNWIKYKKSYDKSSLADTIDAVVMGYDVGQGKRSGFGIGDFLIGVYDAEKDKYLTVAKIGTGLTDDEWRKMKSLVDSCQLPAKPQNYDVMKVMEVDVWAKPKIVVEIKADEITKSPMHTAGVALRFPRLVSFREKEPEKATSLKEMEKLYKLQKK